MKIQAAVTFPESDPGPGRDLRRVRKWGDPVMVKWGFDYDNISTSNFQAVKTWNPETGLGAVSNYLYIPHAEVLQIRNMQFPEQTDRSFFDRDSKMNWLCGYRGKMYMYDNDSDHWRTAAKIRWGTVSLGGNLVSVEGYESHVLSIDGEPRRSYTMARLKGFTPADWARPLDELLESGLVHRCYCVYRNNGFGDTPKGVIYSPFFSPLYYDFAGVKQPRFLYLPEMWLED